MFAQKSTQLDPISTFIEAFVLKIFSKGIVGYKWIWLTGLYKGEDACTGELSIDLETLARRGH